MGIELDVLVGHPEHDLLFVASQIAKAAGLKNAYAAASAFKKLKQNQSTTFLELGPLSNSNRGLRDAYDRKLPDNTSIFTEAQVYQMLLRGRAEASEPFRKWVTEEVLPTIRKTGQYNAAESSDPIALGIMDELKLLRGELVELKDTRCSI